MPGENNWPTFFVVGGQKCGTTSVYEHLRRHPEVFLPQMKEPAFFAAQPAAGETRIVPGGYASFEEYRNLYLGAKGFAAIGDASPHYLCDEESARRIHEVSPQAKIIIMLRDPVIRAHSAYLMNLGRQFDSAVTFRQALEWERGRNHGSWFTSWRYVEAGLYHDQVRRYLDMFGDQQVLILLFDDLQRSPVETFSRITRHIGVSSLALSGAELSRPYNTFRMPRFMSAFRLARKPALRRIRHAILPERMQRWLRNHPLLYGKTRPALDDESRRYLQGIYDPDISRLEDLLGRKIPELRKSWV